MKRDKINGYLKYGVLVLAIVMLSGLSSCKKFVDTPIPTNQIAASVALNSDASLVAALLGAYASVANVSATVVIEGSFFSDDMVYPTPSSSDLQAINNTYDATADYGFFSNYYKAIYNINLILDVLNAPNNNTPALAAQVKGECEFLRAFCYYRLVNYYGDVPLVLSSNVAVSANVPNTPSGKTLDQAIADLQDAKNLLTPAYPSVDKVRANRSAVSALLARIYLQRQDWANAEAAATEVINAGTYTLPTDLNSVFVKGSTETIWQLWNLNTYTSVGLTIIPATATANVFYQLRPELVNAYDVADKRKAAWIKAGTYLGSTVYYPYKYKQRAATTTAATEYLVQFRLAEQYLIRAEARAQQQTAVSTTGLADLNVVHLRANTLPLAATSKADLLLKIETERRLELMTEESLRWFDLNRTGRTAAVLGALKPGFMAKAVLLPYPTTILLASPALKQNPGYN